MQIFLILTADSRPPRYLLFYPGPLRIFGWKLLHSHFPVLFSSLRRAEEARTSRVINSAMSLRPAGWNGIERRKKGKQEVCMLHEYRSKYRVDPNCPRLSFDCFVRPFYKETTGAGTYSSTIASSCIVSYFRWFKKYFHFYIFMQFI